MNQPLIFCVEDDDSIRELICYALNSGGYQAQGFSSSAALWHRMATEKPDLLVLDIMLPGEDGLHILQRLKEDASTRSVPVIMLTAKTSELDKVAGLDAGADDYITKPFSVLELLSRIRAVLRCRGLVLRPGDHRPAAPHRHFRRQPGGTDVQGI